MGGRGGTSSSLTGEAVTTARADWRAASTGSRYLHSLVRLDAFDHTDGSLRAHDVLVARLCRHESGEPLAADHAAEGGSWARISSGARPLSKDVEHIAGPLPGGTT